jgi:serine/threonine-protein kinase RsbT
MAMYEIREAIDLYAPRQGVKHIGASLGFSRNDCHELAIVVSELASNILKYGIRGTISIEDAHHAKSGSGVLLIARDQGRPFHDLEMAMRDGWDDRGPIDPATLLKRGGLGTGLGAIIRLSDSFEVQVLPVGKEIRVVRYRARPKMR